MKNEQSRFEDCDICGERYHNEYIERYTTETIVGTGNDTEVITHCNGCIPKKKAQKKINVTKNIEELINDLCLIFKIPTK